MIGRNRRGSRQASKVRLGIATAVLVGGAAVGVAAVAANNHGPAATTAESAGFIMHFHHNISEQTALSSALGMWGTSQQRSMNTLAQMVPMRTFSQVWHRHTLFAAQRGIVELATRRFLLVKSANGALHLWWLTRGTVFQNVSASPTGMTAMTGNNTAAVQAMVNRNMAPAAVAMAGGSNIVNQMAAPAAKPATITVDTGSEVITITITSTTATVTQPVTAPTTAPTPSVSPSTSPSGVPTTMATPTTTPTATVTQTATPTPSATATQPTFTSTQGVARGDLVFIAGMRVHGFLIAKLVLFSAPATTPTPTVTPSTTVSPSMSATPVMSGTPSMPVTPTAPGTLTGTHS